MRPSIPIEKIEKIVELTKKGMFRKKIAKAVGVSAITVYNYQRKLGLI